jgi:hypothetical protein
MERTAFGFQPSTASLHEGTVSVRFLIIETDYPGVLTWLYDEHPGLREETFDTQIRVRNERLAGLAILSGHLRRLGHDVMDVYVNNAFAQVAWAREHGVPARPRRAWRGRLRRGWIPWYGPQEVLSTELNILSAQIEAFAPDVIVNQAMDTMPADFFRLHPDVALAGGGQPPVMGNPQDWSPYDVVLAPSEGMVRYFRQRGLRAELFRFGFEADLLHSEAHRVEPGHNGTPVRFAGMAGGAHTERGKLLEFLSDRLGSRLGVWGPTVFPQGSALQARYRGPAWGETYFRTLGGARIVVNCHIDLAGEYADNMRLFEAPGMGALLVTDWKVNLGEIYRVGDEVVAYRTPGECLELVEYYLTHEDERAAIARAGQARTLSEHTYAHRARELEKIMADFV